MLGGYYSQQQFLRNLDIKANLVPVDQPSAMDQAYKEFIMQQGSRDTRRDFGCKLTITNSASRAMPARTLRCWTI